VIWWRRERRRRWRIILAVDLLIIKFWAPIFKRERGNSLRENSVKVVGIFS